jgi:phage/plasmid-associated DNA primase
VISEANPKEQWNEALLKQITGGDMISARNMREDASEFASEAGLLVMVNDKPNITHASVALLRRFRMIGTEQRPAIADSKLAEKIMMFEAPALLTKLMQYARKVWNPEAGEYEHMGLPPVPAAMNAVAREFMSENDPFYAWLIAECDIGAEVREEMESLAVLKGRYENWAKREGQGLAGLGGEAMNMKEFRGALQRMGIATTNERGGALKMRGGTGGGVDAAQGVRLKLKNVA